MCIYICVYCVFGLFLIFVNAEFFFSSYHPSAVRLCARTLDFLCVSVRATASCRSCLVVPVINTPVCHVTS